MSNRYRVYRFYNDDGSSKDWAVCDNADGSYTSRWGKTGAKLQSKTFVNMLPMQDHIKSKEDKGYRYLGEYFIQDDHRLIPATGTDPDPVSPSLPEKPDDSRIFWRIRVSTSEPASIELFRGLVRSCSQTLLSHYPDSEWIFAINNRYRNSTFVISEAGFWLKEDGVAPVLLFMLLKKIVPSGIAVTMAHEDGVEISDQLKMEPGVLSFFDLDIDSVRDIAEEIGLLEKRINLAMIAPELEDFYF